MTKPIITIGITTYNRLDYLRDTLRSLIKNNYEIEILIGNDYTNDILNISKIGVNDKRIRIINNSENLGELGNMNYLLSQARGEYFTWIFDDDPVSIYLIDRIIKAIKENINIKCIYTNYKKLVGTNLYFDNKEYAYNPVKYTGRDFLIKYLRGEIKALGCLGFYNTEYLKGLGGAAKLSSGKIALHAEYDLIIKSGLLDHLVYIDAPLVTTRVHNDSWSISNTEYILFAEAGLNLIKNNLNILLSEKLKKDFDFNFKKLLGFVISSIVCRHYASGFSLNTNTLEEVFYEINKVSDEINDNDIREIIKSTIRKIRKKIFLYRIKGILKLVFPLWVLKFYGQ